MICSAVVWWLLFCAVLSGTVSGGPQRPLSQSRIYSELREIIDQGLPLTTQFNTSNDDCGVRLSPLKSNLLEWHFTFTGMEGSNYEGGIYHGKIVLDSKYPQKAPAICMLTPSGRWKVGEYICLSASAHHPELWDPSWNLRTLVLSLRGFMTTQANEIGSVRSSAITQRELAAASREYKCPLCHSNHKSLMPGGNGISASEKSSLAAKLLLSTNTGNAGRRVASAAKAKVKGAHRPSQVVQVDTETSGLSKDSKKNIGQGSRRLGILRKSLLYPLSILLFGLWRLCSSMIHRYFQTVASSMS